MFSKVIEYLETSNTGMNIEHSETILKIKIKYKTLESRHGHTKLSNF